MEEPKQTCPDIDQVQSLLEHIHNRADDPASKKMAKAAQSIMEDVRQNCKELRSWGKKNNL